MKNVRTRDIADRSEWIHFWHLILTEGIWTQQRRPALRHKSFSTVHMLQETWLKLDIRLSFYFGTFAQQHTGNKKRQTASCATCRVKP